MSTHVPVMLEEVIGALQPHAGAIYVDGTFGGGGYTEALLARADCTVYGIDRDAAAIARGQSLAERFAGRLTLIHGCFSEMDELLATRGVTQADGVALDLGVSSFQLDEAERGFSFRFDAPLDMRMDRSAGLTLAQWLNSVDEAELAKVIWDYGEERFAKQVAKAIVAARAGGPILGTGRLADIVGAAVRTREPGFHPATRTFQALRIHINQELEELSLMLPQAVRSLAPQGRLAVISFHSLEDRIVKRYLQDEARPDNLPARLPVRAAELPQPQIGRAHV